MVSALASTVINGVQSTYAQSMAGPLWCDWKWAIDEESTSICFYNTFTTVNSKDVKQLLLKPVGCQWVFKTKRNSDVSTDCRAHLVIKGYKKAEFSKIYAPVGKLTSFWYHISLIRKCGLNINPLDVMTVFLNPGINDDDFLTVLPKGLPEGQNDMRTCGPPIIVTVSYANYCL
jgi:hypothetical protein